MTVGNYCIPVYGSSADLLLDQFSVSACLIDMVLVVLVLLLFTYRRDYWKLNHSCTTCLATHKNAFSANTMQSNDTSSTCDDEYKAVGH